LKLPGELGLGMTLLLAGQSCSGGLTFALECLFLARSIGRLQRPCARR
jgi:hypothetical protein